MTGLRGEIAQQGQLALTDHALSVITVSTENSANRAVCVRHRTVGEGVVGFLGVAVALHDQQLGLHVRTLLATQSSFEHRTDIAPDLAPDLMGGPTECPRVSATDDGFVRV